MRGQGNNPAGAGRIDPEALTHARRAMALGQSDPVIRKAVESAPPIDPETLSWLQALIPPPPPDSEIPGA